MPSLNYVEFSRQTIRRIAESNDAGERSALGGSLVAAEEQLTESTGLVEGIKIAPKDDAELLLPFSENSFNIYDETQLDLIKARSLPAELTYPALLLMSSALSFAELARRVLAALIRCNKTAALYGSAEIFKPTLQSIEARVLKWIFPKTENI